MESERARKLEGRYRVCGDVKRHNPFPDPYEQPRNFWERVLDDGERRRVVVNIVNILLVCTPVVQRRILALFANVSKELASMVEEELRNRQIG